MKNLNILVFIATLQILVSCCKATTSTSNKTFTVNTWSGAWTFTGFAIGPSSGEYYNLLSSSAEGQCALIKETASGSVTWSKFYAIDQCSGLSVDSTETYIYFASNNNAAYFGVNQVSCSTGESNTYVTDDFLNITGGIGNIDAKNNPGFVVLGGNLLGSGDHECIVSWNVSGNGYAYSCSNSDSKFFGAFAVPSGYCTGSRRVSTNQHTIGCGNTSVSSSLWYSVLNFSDSFSSESLNIGKMDADTSNVYCAFEPTSSSGIFLITFNIADGSYEDIIRQRQSSNQLKLGSVQATGSSVVYVSVYSSNSAYTELIKLNVSSTDYTIYQQTGLDFRLQYINTALSDCWYGLLDTQYIHYSQLSLMDEVADLNVTTLTNTGLTNVNNTNSSTVGDGSLNVPGPSGSFVTTTTNAAAAFNVSISVLIGEINTTTNSTSQTNTTQTSNNTTTNNTTENNSDDDSLGIVPIVLIILGCVVLIVIGIGTVLSVIKCRKNSKNRRPDMSRVENPADETNVLKEENQA